ncbi:DUF3618 domain-containing protein [Plantactinospora sonchi]|uniref:DUF3618 domain-containing protein n=1 Tax=Plantactinospora sonchi TaxID=1544735 RepID=A0ABU7RLB7_9ACTN
MSTDPSQIRAEIERTQDDLGDNVNALTDRMNPRSVARRQKEQVQGRARGTWQRIRDKVMGTSQHARESVMGGSQHAKESVMGGTHHARESVMGGAQHAREGVQHARETSQARLSAASSMASDRMHQVGQSTRQQTEGHPLAAGLVAFGLGVLASAMLPPSSPERRMAGQLRNKISEHSDQIDQIKQQATGVARQAQDNLREPAQQAAQSVRSKAGQEVSGMRDQARSSAQEVRGQAQEKAGEVRRR